MRTSLVLRAAGRKGPQVRVGAPSVGEGADLPVIVDRSHPYTKRARFLAERPSEGPKLELKGTVWSGQHRSHQPADDSSLGAAHFDQHPMVNERVRIARIHDPPPPPVRAELGLIFRRLEPKPEVRPEGRRVRDGGAHRELQADESVPMAGLQILDRPIPHDVVQIRECLGRRDPLQGHLRNIPVSGQGRSHVEEHVLLPRGCEPRPRTHDGTAAAINRITTLARRTHGRLRHDPQGGERPEAHGEDPSSPPRLRERHGFRKRPSAPKRNARRGRRAGGPSLFESPSRGSPSPRQGRPLHRREHP